MAAGDDVDHGNLKKVKGIGVKVEGRLKDAGITTLERLARTPVNELAALLDGVPGRYDEDRITREGWLPQAAALASAPAAAALEDAAKIVRHNFTLEVRLNIAGRGIASSKIVHVQTGDEATWAGWKPMRLVAFMEDRAGVRSARSTIEPDSRDLAGTSSDSEPENGEIGQVNGLALYAFAMVSASGSALPVSGPTAATLSFDAQAAALPAHQPARAKVDIYARRPPPGKSLLVGSAVADVSSSGRVQLQVPCHLPTIQDPAGVFAAVQLFAAAEAGRQPACILPDASLTVTRSPAAMPVTETSTAYAPH